jgi:hypothetical protein
MKILKSDQIWDELENQSSSQSGLLYKRYSVEVIPDIYIALKAPEKLRCIAVRINRLEIPDLLQLDTLKDVKIESMPDESNQEKMFLLILLINSNHKDIFTTLCEDLIAGVSDAEDEAVLIGKLLERYAKWQALFHRITKKGLSPEEQRGLYGELYFLYKYLQAIDDQIQCLKTWTGPEKAIQDFQFSNWAVEVKTTHGNNHQKVSISSERQLDDQIIPNIFLFHLSLEVRNGHGETLNTIVEKIYEFISEKTIAVNIFKMKLMEAGYFEIHKALYEESGYSIRQENCYKISEGFPRITEQQIPGGVGDVRYSIVLTESEPWRINEPDLLKQISE